MGSCSFLLGIFPTHGLNLRLLHCRWTLHCLSHREDVCVCVCVCVCVYTHMLSCFTCVCLCDSTVYSPPGSRQKHWSALPGSPPGDLPNPGIERLLHWQADSLLLVQPGKPIYIHLLGVPCTLEATGDPSPVSQAAFPWDVTCLSPLTAEVAA